MHVIRGPYLLWTISYGGFGGKKKRLVQGYMTWAMSRGLPVSHNFVIIYLRSGTSDINLMFSGHFVPVYFHIYNKIQVPSTGTIYTEGLHMMITIGTEKYLAIEID